MKITTIPAGDPNTPISPLGRIKVAVTFDDLLLMRGYETPEGVSHLDKAKRMMAALQRHNIKGVYQFSNTAPLQDDPTLRNVFDAWVENGHHVGNHTHHHSSLNWMSADQYAADIDMSEKLIRPYLSSAPRRTFRFCMDMWGNTECKCREILRHLKMRGYEPIPVSIGFHDIRWNAAHVRITRHGSPQDVHELRRGYVESAVREMRIHAANARAVFGRDPSYIWLIHGTAIAAECLGDILDRFAQAGVDFVSLGEAMLDSVNNTIPDRISPEFIFQIEKWALAKGVPVYDLHPKVLEEIETFYPVPGGSGAEASVRMRAQIAAHSGAAVSPFEPSTDQIY